MTDTDTTISADPSAGLAREDGPPAGLACARCKGPLRWSGASGDCPRCGRVAILRGGIADFLDAGGPIGTDDGTDRADAFGFLDRAGPWLVDLLEGRAISTEAEADLERLGLVGPGPRLTEPGRKLAYHLTEGRQQEQGDWVEGFLGQAAPGPDARVLDVGCGAGQTLRALGRYGPARRLGLDADLELLAVGRRLARRRGEAIDFVRATAHSLPLADGWFSLIICRVALNYMHQRQALQEMARVLGPGGLLICGFEGPGYDLGQLALARGGRQRLCRLRNLGMGLLLESTGWQPTPGHRISGDRAFVTARRLARVLGRAGCETIRTSVLSRRLGFSTEVNLLARKRGDGPVGRQDGITPGGGT